MINSRPSNSLPTRLVMTGKGRELGRKWIGIGIGTKEKVEKVKHDVGERFFGKL